MAKSFHELSSKAQMGVFIGLCVLTGAAGWQVFLAPQQAAIAKSRTRVAGLETDLVRAQGVAARLPQAQKEVKLLEARLRETEAVLPDEKDPQDVLRNLHEVASDARLDIASFTPRVVATKAEYAEWPIELGLEGTYHDLGRFFDRIASMPRLMSVADLQIKTSTKSNGRVSITASCLATTYVFNKDLTERVGRASGAAAKPAAAAGATR